MSRVNNNDAIPLIRNRQDFENHGGTMYASHMYGPASLYVVYSYGPHFPMAIYEFQTRQWFYNTDHYSPITGRHQSVVRDALPSTYHRMDTSMLEALIHCEGRQYKLSQQIGYDLRQAIHYAPLLAALQP